MYEAMMKIYHKQKIIIPNQTSKEDKTNLIKTQQQKKPKTSWTKRIANILFKPKQQQK
jgi:hypothetical protein